MSSNHESQPFYAKYEAYIKREKRLDKIYLIANTVAAGSVAGAVIGLVLDINFGTMIATGAGTMLGGTLGLLTGAIWLLVKRRRSDAELFAPTEDSDAELFATIEDGDADPPESV